MLNSIGVVVVIIGLFYMIVWLLKNDGANTINDQRGIFAMRRVSADNDAPEDDPKAPPIRRPSPSNSRFRSRRTWR